MKANFSQVCINISGSNIQSMALVRVKSGQEIIAADILSHGGWQAATGQQAARLP